MRAGIMFSLSRDRADENRSQQLSANGPSPPLAKREGEGQAGASVAQFRDDPERLLAACDALKIVKGVAPALPVIVPGRTGAVGAEDRILQGEQLVVRFWRLFDHDVEPGTQDLLVAQCRIERPLVDHRSAAGIDQD